MTEKTPRQKTAIVIGAGAGGIATAARLAAAGFSVTVLEKNSFLGGRCSLLHSPSGHRFDQGPSLLLLPHLFYTTFSDLGTSLSAENVELLKCEPNYNIWFQDGERIRLSSDLAVMKSEIEKWEGKEGYERYLKFLEESHKHYELSVTHVLEKNFEGVMSMLRWGFLKELTRLHPFESIWTRAGKYFWTERLRRVFTFGSMYMGMSPFDAPGTYSLLQYTEFAEGIWYPRGGFYRVIEAIGGVGERLGVRVRKGEGVKRIRLVDAGGKVEGVEMESGEVIKADVVVNNTDLVYAYNELLPQTAYAEGLKKRPGSCSSISFYWGLSRKVKELDAHNIFLAEEYRESFDSIFKKHLIPDEPSFYVNVPSRIDETAAPEGTDSVVVLVPVGHLMKEGEGKGGKGGERVPTATQDWPAMVALARKTILATIAARTGVDLAPLIVHELTNTPLTWRDSFNLDKGAILGLSHSFFNVLCFRPTTRARRPAAFDPYLKSLGVAGRVLETCLDATRGSERDVTGLYMIGASAHPGTGVPIVLAGAKLVTEQICEDLGIEIPWRKTEGAQGKGALDRVERPLWLDDWGQWFAISAVMALVGWVLLFGVVAFGR